MAKGINKVILVGRLGKDPDVRTGPSGVPVANISLATGDSWQDKQTGEWRESTEWHRVVFFRRLAEVVGQYLHKGSQIYVEGYLQTRKWQDKNTGQDRYMTEIIAREMQMLDSRTDSPNYGTPAAAGGNYSPYAQQPNSGGYGAPPPPPVNPGMGQPNYSQPYSNQSPGQPPAYPPPYPPENTGQPISPPPYTDGGMGQPTSPPPVSNARKPPEKDPDFDQDVPF